MKFACRCSGDEDTGQYRFAVIEMSKLYIERLCQRFDIAQKISEEKPGFYAIEYFDNRAKYFSTLPLAKGPGAGEFVHISDASPLGQGLPTVALTVCVMEDGIAWKGYSKHGNGLFETVTMSKDFLCNLQKETNEPGYGTGYDVSDQICKQWQAEGWDVFQRSDGTLEIECLAESDAFSSDDEATAHVIDRALKGSTVHALALWLDGRQTGVTRPSYWVIPPALRVKEKDRVASSPHPQLVLEIEGGLIREIHSSNPDIEVAIVNWDTEDASPDEPDITAFRNRNGKFQMVAIHEGYPVKKLEAISGILKEVALRAVGLTRTIMQDDK